jgi:hypothetical protein
MPRIVAKPTYAAVTIPARRLSEVEGVGRNTLWRLMSGGQLDSVIVGGKHRHVVVASWDDYLDRQRLGVERNPVQKAAAIASYRSSLAGVGGQAAARARRGTAWGRKLAAEAEGGSTLEVLTDPPRSGHPRPAQPRRRKVSSSTSPNVAEGTPAIS